jgi:hypothetical protein
MGLKNYFRNPDVKLGGSILMYGFCAVLLLVTFMLAFQSLAISERFADRIDYTVGQLNALNITINESKFVGLCSLCAAVPSSMRGGNCTAQVALCRMLSGRG